VGFKQTREWIIFYEGFWLNNASFRMMLGLCSTLAVTNNLKNSFTMSMGVIFVSSASSTMISVMRTIIPPRIRMAVFMMSFKLYQTI